MLFKDLNHFSLIYIHFIKKHFSVTNIRKIENINFNTF